TFNRHNYLLPWGARVWAASIMLSVIIVTCITFSHHWGTTRTHLNSLGLLEALGNHPDSFRALFVDSIKPPTARDLFKVTYSIPGGNRRCLENDTILAMVLEFATGATVVPPLGFEDTPTIEFLHTFPEANTCAVTLRLPLHSTFNTFREFMTSGIVNSPHFGFA
uniref:HECT domain-containing protein n=1 Tax=Oncorhynchus mykiss TaxID=8022 RepID=A0A8C7NWX5_ONCMY